MAGLNETAKNNMLDHLGTLITHISIHSADPGATGLNEVAVTRQTISWNSATGSNLDSVGTQEFSVDADTTVHSVGLWSAVSGGTFYGSRALPAPETFSNAGTFTVNDLDIAVT